MTSTTNNTALVTGTNSGLGIEATAQLAAQRALWNFASKAASLPATQKEET
jgi:NAD(P)-dependent dehydrogenase (short-subunit alcohol dehydrogenase family)